MDNAFSAPVADDVLLPLDLPLVHHERTVNVACWFVERELPDLADEVAFLVEDCGLRAHDLSSQDRRGRRLAQLRWRTSLLPGATHIECYRTLTAFLTVRNGLQRSRWRHLLARIEDRIQRAVTGNPTPSDSAQ